MLRPFFIARFKTRVTHLSSKPSYIDYIKKTFIARERSVTNLKGAQPAIINIKKC